jgi:DNA polymerase-3 subunit delta
LAEASVFELVDAIGTRHSRSAARLLHKKLSDGSNPFQLFAMVVRQFRFLIQVKELSEAGSPPGEIASRLKLHGFVAGKLNQQSRNFTPEQLKTIYAHLLSVDVGAKTGVTDMITALNLFVAGVTT